MGYTDILWDSLDAVQFESDGIKQIQSNTNAVTYGVITTIIAGLATSIGTLNPIGLIGYPILYLISVFISAGLTHLAAKLFDGQGSFRDFFAVLANGEIVYWVSVIPVLGWFLAPLASLYYIAYTIYVIKEVHNLGVAKSIGAFILPVIVIGVILFLVAVFFASLLATIGLGGVLSQL